MTVEELRDELNEMIYMGYRDAAVVTGNGVRILTVERREGAWCGGSYALGYPAGTTRPLVVLGTKP